MFTIILRFPKGLKDRVTDCLNAISQNTTIEGNYAIVDYMGVGIEFREHLYRSDLLDLVEILEVI